MRRTAPPCARRRRPLVAPFYAHVLSFFLPLPRSRPPTAPSRPRPPSPSPQGPARVRRFLPLPFLLHVPFSCPPHVAPFSHSPPPFLRLRRPSSSTGTCFEQALRAECDLEPLSAETNGCLTKRCFATCGSRSPNGSTTGRTMHFGTAPGAGRRGELAAVGGCHHYKLEHALKRDTARGRRRTETARGWRGAPQKGEGRRATPKTPRSHRLGPLREACHERHRCQGCLQSG